MAHPSITEYRPKEFDPCIKYGRDNRLWLKRDAIEKLLKEVRFTESELQNMMVIYTSYAKPKKGLDKESFGSLLSHFIKTPLLDELFWSFDADKDGLLTF